MRLLVYSDLHLEFPAAMRRFRVPEGLAYDAVILAGDIHQHTHAIEWAEQTFAGKLIIYVMGNHEAYRAHLPGLIGELRQTARDHGVTFLQCDEHVDREHGVRFLGTTLWTNFALFGGARANACMLEAARCMPDFKIIRMGKTRVAPDTSHPDAMHSAILKPGDTVKFFNQAKRWLAGKLAEPFAGRTVVVTHHLPSAVSVALRYQNDPVSAAFASRADKLVAQADLWIHGHTHDSFDYAIGKCRVICNPRGYPDKLKDTVENRAFLDDFVVEV
ncbi:MAG: metallophosphoesterase [Proteobacteria bacterium]|nr:metallophosphoesterase [Pseudomonadota bacterium]